MSFLKIADPKKRDFIVTEFLKSKNNIQQNSLAEKLGDIGMQRELTKLYKPITDSQSLQSAALTKEISALKETTSSAFQALMPGSQLKAIQFPLYPSIQAETDEGPTESLIELGPIATRYLRSMASKTLTDKTFGLHDLNGDFYIGVVEVTISGDDIIVGEDKFGGTPGLWELITSKNPDSGIYNASDIDNYTTILLNTNAMINPTTGKVKSSSSEKYKNIIKPIYDEHFKLKKTKQLSPSLRQVPSTSTLLPKKGKGFALMPSHPDSLIEMLSLRVGSYKAGNTGVRDEIVDLSDELLRQKVINNEEYKKLMLLL